MAGHHGKRKRDRDNEGRMLLAIHGTGESVMDAIPVEVIGNILSHVAAARDVVRASATSRQWREAAHHHLLALRFQTADWPGYETLDTKDLELVVTQTILKTSCLEQLSIRFDDLWHDFSDMAVSAWLLHTRDSLRFLTYTTISMPRVNVFERCGNARLQSLVFGHTETLSKEYTAQRFPSLLSLTLSEVCAGAADLNLLLSGCPKLESFSLLTADRPSLDPRATLKLTSSSLKSFMLEDYKNEWDNIILEADNLEALHLRKSTIEHFRLVSKGSLRMLRIDDLCIIHELDIGEATDLEIVDLSNSCTEKWAKFDHMISRPSSKLTKLRLWHLTSDDYWEVRNLETIAFLFPRLNHLALSFELKGGMLEYLLQGSSILEKVVLLELDSITLNNLFVDYIAGVLGRCPNLRRLVVHGHVFEAKNCGHSRMIGKFSTSFFKVLNQFPLVCVELNNL